MKTQIHISIEEETKNILKKASNNLGVNLSAFMIYTCVERAKKIIKEKEEIKNAN